MFALLLFSSVFSAYALNVTVLDNNDNPIRLQNTNVSILLGNTVLYTQQTNISGQANRTSAKAMQEAMLPALLAAAQTISKLLAVKRG